MLKGRALWALGTMSGTSLDGVDAAMVLTDGHRIEAFGPAQDILQKLSQGQTAAPPKPAVPVREEPAQASGSFAAVMRAKPN